MLDTQFRAILRAASAGTVRILLPFVTTAAEVDAARARFSERARDALAREGVAAPRVSLGAMIEVPAAALTADLLAGHADFLALGTNDLAQYLLAADRTDSACDRAGPARAIRRCCACCKLLPRLAARHGLPLSVCGEMASDPVLLALLVGLRRPRLQHDASSAAGAAPHRRARVACGARRRRAARAPVELSLAPIEDYVTRRARGSVDEDLEM